MLSRVSSMGLQGIDGYEVSVECYITNGLPSFDVVGLPDAAVKEARERVRAAVKNCGFKFPTSRITLNLAPAGTKKTGTLYDLPILLGILAANGTLRLPKIPFETQFKQKVMHPKNLLFCLFLAKISNFTIQKFPFLQIDEF